MLFKLLSRQLRWVRPKPCALGAPSHREEIDSKVVREGILNSRLYDWLVVKRLSWALKREHRDVPNTSITAP